MTPSFIDTPNAIVSLSQDGHVVIRIKENTEIEVEDIRLFQVAKKELVGETKHTVIFITPQHGSISHEAREYSASREVNKNAIAKAIVTRSLSSRMFSNFFIRINRPATPTRLFETEEAASDWLKKMKAEYLNS